MAYNIDSAWERGQTITAERLNHMEKGIASALNAIGKAFGKEYDDSSNEEYTVSLDGLVSNKSITTGAITGTTLTATGATSGDTLSITGASGLKGNVTIGTTDTTVDTTINGKLNVTGKNVEVDGSTVKQAANFTGTLDVSGATNLGDTLTVNGNITVGDSNTDNSIENKIYGTTTLFGKLEARSNESALLQGSLTVNGNSFINSNFYHQINQVQENDGSTTWFPDGSFYAYYKTIILGMKGEMIRPNQPGERIISEDNSSTISLSGRLLTIYNTTTNIQSSYTNIKGNLIIGTEENPITTSSLYGGLTVTDKITTNTLDVINGTTIGGQLTINDSTTINLTAGKNLQISSTVDGNLPKIICTNTYNDNSKSLSIDANSIIFNDIIDIHNYGSTFAIKHLIAGSEYNLFSYQIPTRQLEIGQDIMYRLLNRLTLAGKEIILNVYNRDVTPATYGTVTVEGSLQINNGNLILAQDPVTNMHAATKQYVDTKISEKLNIPSYSDLTDGTYILQMTLADGIPTYKWILGE